jgi:hypothetical protein
MERNLADPSFEPTDEDLQGLSKRAFAGVAAENASVLAAMRARIRASHAQFDGQQAKAREK